MDLTLQKYNYMLVGAFDLLMAKQREFDDYQKYIEVVRDYWIIRTDITRAAGGRMPATMETGAITPDSNAAISSAGKASRLQPGSADVVVQGPSGTPSKEK